MFGDNNEHNIAHDENNQSQIREPKVTVKAVTLGMCASMGGMVFGYESGQISGGFILLIALLDHRVILCHNP